MCVDVSDVFWRQVSTVKGRLHRTRGALALWSGLGDVVSVGRGPVADHLGDGFGPSAQSVFKILQH